jgi:hypothetical protein
MSSPVPTVIRLATRGETVHIVITVQGDARYQRYSLVNGQPFYENSVVYMHEQDAIAQFEKELKR